MKKLLAITYISAIMTILIFPVNALANGSTDDARVNQQGEHPPVAVNNILTPELRTIIARQLGWIADLKPQNLCRGYYQEPLLNQLPTQFASQDLTRVSANEAILKQTGRSTLQDSVIIEQLDRRSSADLAYIYTDEQSTDISDIELYGNVQVREPGTLIIADQAAMNLVNNTGTMDNTLYRLALDAENNQLADNRQLWGNVAWGQANQIRQVAQDRYVLDNASFSTCPPLVDAWDIKADNIHLNTASEVGTARNVTLRVKGIPVIYSPYLSFPLSNKRKSGFLTPAFGFTDQSGFELALPYYVNLAPNYDFTLLPSLYTRRGIMIGGEARYLTPRNAGEITANFLPNDRAFASFINDNADMFSENFPAPDNKNRAAIQVLHTTQFDENWAIDINYNKVSDDFYLQDFGKNLADVTLNKLVQRGDFRYAGPHWQFISTLQGYQSLSPFNERGGGRDRAVYSFLPRLVLNASYPDQWHGLNLGFSSEYTNFVWPGRTPRVEGERINLNPIITMPITNIAAYITPTAQLMQTNYDLSFQSPPTPNSINRTIPLFNVNSGVFFERYTTLGQQDYLHTLEPRVYYLYVPFVNQDEIPNFDTSEYRFTFNQLFRPNRFTGIDRVGDANQISLALTTRFLDANSGIEKFSASIGQIYYFQNRRVLLKELPIDFDEEDVILNTLSPTSNYSPIAGILRYNFNQRWGAGADLAWDPATQATNNANVNVYYQPTTRRIINVGYTFLVDGDKARAAVDKEKDKDNNLSQIYASYAWPLTEKWHTLGILTQNISKGFSMEYFFGLEYDTCCWAARVIGGRSFLRLDQHNERVFRNAIYFQILLKGLGTLAANNPRDVIAGIRGYQDPFR